MILGATITGSLILNSVNLASITGSEASINALNSFTASAATTGSNVFKSNQTVTGSVNITGSLTVVGPITGTVTTASYVLNAISASYALNATSASYALVTTSASYAANATSASYAANATTASYALVTTTASYAANSDLLDSRDSLTFANTGSNAFIGTQNINGAVAITGSLTTTGAITAQTLNVQQVTSSIVYSSGSNIFGNSVSNTQSMTGSVGISGSLAVTGPTTITGILTLNSTISNGTYIYTLPSATGTLALTSALSGYLPLTGGTLTGALSGTSATFSSTVSATQYTATSTGGSGLRVYGSAGTNQWDIYLNSTNLRFSDNTGTGSVVFDRPLSGTSATFTTTSSGSSTVSGITLLTSTNTHYSAYQVGNGRLVGRTSQGDTYWSSNTDLFTATITGTSSYLRQASGEFSFLNAVSVSAGASPTFVTQLAIASTGAATFTGNVGVGTNKTSGVLNAAFEVYNNATGAASSTKTRISGGSNGANGGTMDNEFAWNDYGNVDQFNLVARIRGVATSNSGSDVSGKLEFYTKATGGTYSTSPVLALTIASTGAATFSSTITAATLSTFGTAVAAQNVQLNLNGVSGKAQRIEFQNSGVQQWLLGAGAASETSAFELYNANGQMALSFAKATSAATFISSIAATSATFSGNVGITGTSATVLTLNGSAGSTAGMMINASSSTRGGIVFYQQATVDKWQMGMNTGASPTFDLYTQGAVANAVSFAYATGAATFSSTIAASGRISTSHSTSGDYAAVFYNTSATGEGVTIRGGSTASHNAFIVQPYNGATTLFSILATGAATFSNAATNGVTITNTTSSPSLISFTNTANGFSFGFNSTTTQRFVFLNGGPTEIANINGSTGAYTALSDINKKKDFELSTIGLNEVLGLKPTLYRIKEEEEDSDKHLGFIAQEVKEFIPQAYSQSGDFIGLDYNPIIAVLVKAIQELNAKITELENK